MGFCFFPVFVFQVLIILGSQVDQYLPKCRTFFHFWGSLYFWLPSLLKSMFYGLFLTIFLLHINLGLFILFLLWEEAG